MDMIKGCTWVLFISPAREADVSKSPLSFYSKIRRNNKATPKENHLHCSAIPIAAAKTDTGTDSGNCKTPMPHSGKNQLYREPDPAQTLWHAVHCALCAVCWQALLVSTITRR